MALPNLSGSLIQDTFQRVVHTDGAILYDGTGSVVLDATELAELQTLGANNVQWNYLSTIEQRMETSAKVRFAQITASVGITSSVITANRFDINGNKFAALQSPNIFDIGQTGQASLNLTNITASGNISASGDLFFNSISGGTF